jgi:hypothetical protein
VRAMSSAALSSGTVRKVPVMLTQRVVMSMTHAFLAEGLETPSLAEPSVAADGLDPSLEGLWGRSMSRVLMWSPSLSHPLLLKALMLLLLMVLRRPLLLNHLLLLMVLIRPLRGLWGRSWMMALLQLKALMLLLLKALTLFTLKRTSTCC